MIPPKTLQAFSEDSNGSVSPVRANSTPLRRVYQPHDQQVFTGTYCVPGPQTASEQDPKDPSPCGSHTLLTVLNNPMWLWLVD